jgi:hypothetical protein
MSVMVEAVRTREPRFQVVERSILPIILEGRARQNFEAESSGPNWLAPQWSEVR